MAKLQHLKSDLTPMDDTTSKRIAWILERMSELDKELNDLVKPEPAELENLYDMYRDNGSGDNAEILIGCWGRSEDILADRQSALEDAANEEAARIAPGLVDKDKEGQ